MTAKETAAYLGISYWKLTMMCKAYEIPHIRANQVLQIKQTKEAAWMDKLLNRKGGKE